MKRPAGPVPGIHGRGGKVGGGRAGREWLYEGMSMGSAASFMLTGPATKITNLGALKIVLGFRRFLLYLLFVMVFSLMSGIIVNIIV